MKIVIQNLAGFLYFFTADTTHFCLFPTAATQTDNNNSTPSLFLPQTTTFHLQLQLTFRYSRHFSAKKEIAVGRTRNLLCNKKAQLKVILKLDEATLCHIQRIDYLKDIFQ